MVFLKGIEPPAEIEDVTRLAEFFGVGQTAVVELPQEAVVSN